MLGEISLFKWCVVVSFELKFQSEFSQFRFWTHKMPRIREMREESWPWSENLGKVTRVISSFTYLTGREIVSIISDSKFLQQTDANSESIFVFFQREGCKC